MTVAAKRREVAIRWSWWERRKREEAAARARRETARIMAAIRRAPLTRAEEAVTRRLVGLWLHWRKRGWIEPTTAEIAAHVGRDRRTVQRIVAKLEAAGWIAPAGNERGGRGVRKRLVVHLRKLRDEVRRGIPVAVRLAVVGYRFGAVTGYQKGRHIARAAIYNKPHRQTPNQVVGVCGWFRARIERLRRRSAPGRAEPGAVGDPWKAPFLVRPTAVPS